MPQEIEKKNQKRKLKRFVSGMLSFFRILIFASLLYSSTVLYLFNLKVSAGIIFASLSFFLLFSQMDAINKKGN